MSVVTAGRRGPDVRSDLWVELELLKSGGVELNLKSKVDFMYGEVNRKLVIDTLKMLGVEHAHVDIEDTGALPFVIMARLETAVRRSSFNVHRSSFLPAPGPSFALPSARDRWRRSRLYLPGNEPRFMLNARIHRPDAVILDLEDSVPAPDKDAALLVVRNALYALDFGDCERMVRINPLPAGLDEVEPLVHAGVNVILIPKCESAEQVKAVDSRVSSVLSSFDIRHSTFDVFLMPIVETCEGMFKAREIAGASPRVVALTYGLEDYLLDLGGVKTPAGLESLWARSQVANAAKAAGVQAIDTVFADIDDMAALQASCQAAKELGFEGKGCIHPRQVPVVNEAFTPSPAEIEKAQQVVMAFKEAQAGGRNVVNLGSKMIDPPVVERALRTIAMATAMGSGGQGSRGSGLNPRTPEPQNPSES
ncbi:MAG: aldolase/citrate lyase family protein [candidate division WOR-3 bacterium]|nr:aldolase/citrate lyase family protein [candidate division WOR-3 bacterium]